MSSAVANLCVETALAAARERYTAQNHMEMLLRSILVAARGDMFISLAVTKEQMMKLRRAMLEFADEYRPLIVRELSI